MSKLLNGTYVTLHDHTYLPVSLIILYLICPPTPLTYLFLKCIAFSLAILPLFISFPSHLP